MDMPPLNWRSCVSGLLEWAAVAMEAYRIEKLYFESLPGLYVPAYFYIPNGIEKPAAAILYVNGHSPTQNIHYQSYPVKFALLGFVCLIIETIHFGEFWGITMLSKSAADEVSRI